MPTASDIITRSLKDIGVLEGGETPTPEEALDALEMLNDMIDSWSTEHNLIFNNTEMVMQTQTNMLEYTLGDGGTFQASFTGSIANNILTITAINSGSVTQNMTLGGAGIPTGTLIAEEGTGAFGTGSGALGTYILDRPFFTPIASEAIIGYYQRPTIINTAFVRVTYQNGGDNFGQYIDYPVQVLTLDQYEGIGIKSLPGPWVKTIFYNPGAKLGQLFVWPNPGIGELHLFTQTLFSRFPSLQVNIPLMTGYTMALRWSLAEALMPMFGKGSQTQAALVGAMAKKYRGNLKRLNSTPVQIVRFDDQLIQGKSRDAGWVLSGGFF